MEPKKLGIAVRNSAIPHYEQIYVQMAALILSGKIPPDTKLPTEQQLADYLGVSRGTVTRAFSFLTREGLIVWSRGKGKFSATQPEIDRVAKVVRKRLT